jgi:hypothetical protein
MDRLLFFVCLAVTSLAGYWLGRKALGFDRVSLASVVASALERLGASVIFLVANVLLGTLASIAVRTLTSHFIGLYAFSDAILLPLSLLQGLAFWSWRERAKAVTTQG